MNRYLLYGFILLCTVSALAQGEMVSKTIKILPGSQLSIQGDTNITEFGCGFDTDYLEGCKKINYTENENDIYFKNAILILKNKGFDCGSKGINKDFHSLLKTSEYPQISLQLIKVNFLQPDKGIALVNITIAGISREYTLPINIPKALDRFTGNLRLNINDFNLEPPRKMLGLIVIKKEIEINFDILVKP